MNQLSWNININVDGYNHVLIGNLSFKAQKGNYAYISTNRCTLTNNTFLSGNHTISLSDFESTDYTQLISKRKTDGSVPDLTFLKLKEISDLYSANIGYQFKYDKTTGTEAIVLPLSEFDAVKNTKYYLQNGVKFSIKGIYIYNGNKILIPK